MVGFLATPWARPRQMTSLYYRGKIGVVLDVTGTNVGQDATGTSIGRLRENRIFASGEFGIKAFGDEGTGVLFLRLSYVRSIYAFSNGSNFGCKPGGLDHIAFDIGIAI